MHVYETTNARQLSLTGLVGIETGCRARLSGGGGRAFQGQFRITDFAVYLLFRQAFMAIPSFSLNS
jgi:hypothetical protein